MLYYRGLSQIGKWKLDDIDQLLRALSICSMSAKSARNKFMVRDWELGEPTSEEWELYGIAIDCIYDYVKDFKDDGMREFRNPPVTFEVNKNVIHFDGSGQLISEISKKVKEKGFKVSGG